MTVSVGSGNSVRTERAITASAVFKPMATWHASVICRYFLQCALTATGNGVYIPDIKEGFSPARNMRQKFLGRAKRVALFWRPHKESGLKPELRHKSQPVDGLLRVFFAVGFPACTGGRKMTKNNESLDRSSGRASIAIHRQAPLTLLLSVVLSLGLVQPAVSAPIDGSSWSYVSYYDHANGDAYTLTQQKQNTLTAGQFATEVSLSENSYAKSSAGIGADGALTGKIAVGTAKGEFTAGQLLQAYSASSYSEGWQLGTGGCVSETCPTVNLSVSLSQTGVFTLGAANFSVNYSLWTPSEVISFYFNIHDESDPFGTSAWLARENLGTGQMSSSEVDVTFTEIDEGLWSFAYTTEANFTTNVDVKEALSLSGRAWSSPDTEYFDSYNSFNAVLAATDAGYVLTSDSGRRIGTADNGGTVPEPGSLYLLGAGLLGLVRLMKRKA